MLKPPGASATSHWLGQIHAGDGSDGQKHEQSASLDSLHVSGGLNQGQQSTVCKQKAPEKTKHSLQLCKLKVANLLHFVMPVPSVTSHL